MYSTDHNFSRLQYSRRQKVLSVPLEFSTVNFKSRARFCSCSYCCSVVQWCPTLCDPWTAACPASLSVTISQSLLKLMSIELMMPSNHRILCHPLFLPPLIFPSISVFSNESVSLRWPKYWNFKFSISYSNEYAGPIDFL